MAEESKKVMRRLSVLECKNVGILIFICLLSSGCSTPYQSNGLGGGYSDTRIQDNVFQVSFRGNGYTGAEKVADLALLHAAEVTLQNGYKYFTILESNQYSKNFSFTTPTTATTTGMLSGTGQSFGNMGMMNGMYTSQTNYSGGLTRHFSKPKQVLTIACFVEKPQTGAFVYDAQQVLSNLGATYGIAPKVKPA